MKTKPSQVPPTEEAKPGLHPRNPHRFRYDFAALLKSSPSLNQYVIENPKGESTVNFANPKAVKALNKALLEHFYRVQEWDLPEGYLCPPIPGRADYIHNVADILAETGNGIIPKGPRIKVLDVGTGASCIYPVIGHREYGWSFLGTEVDAVAFEATQTLLQNNLDLAKHIECRLQRKKEGIFKGIVDSSEVFDITLCNPPFYSSAKEAMAANKRKNRNLKRPTGKPKRNFGGKDTELWFPVGERAFVENIIKESQNLAQQCLWFSSLISNQDHIAKLEHVLKSANVNTYMIKNMSQGQKTSRILVWSYLDASERKQWAKKRWAKS